MTETATAKTRKLRSHAAQKSQPCRWLVCGSAKGGPGKTTCALNIATFAAEAGLRVALLDTDTQQTLSRWHARRPSEAPDIALYAYPLKQIRTALEEIPTGNHDVVIVDTPPGIDDHPVEIRILLDRADYVIVPSTQGSADIDSVTEFMRLLQGLGVRAAFVMNRTNRSYTSFRDAKTALHRVGELCPIDVRQLEDIQSTHRFGIGINEFSRAKGVDDFEGVWTFVRRALEI